MSTEITGYAVSALAYLHRVTANSDFLVAAQRGAHYLAGDAWDAGSHTVPFEPGSPHTYFFDIGIIARGLMAGWRATGDEAFRTRAKEAALSMAFDFLGNDISGGVFHPVIALPEKQPLEYEPRWSRNPGCYQLKSALAWLDLTDDIETSGAVVPQGRRLFDAVLAYSLKTHESFLAEETTREKLMDRLHAYCYFLEALLFVSERDDSKNALRWGIDRVGTLLREIAPEFERSDVCAQLLRVRLVSHYIGAVALDENQAGEEANRASAYQDSSSDARLNGGSWFGRKGSQMLPFMNPVSTAFCMQALDLWDQHRNGEWRFELHQLI